MPSFNMSLSIPRSVVCFVGKLFLRHMSERVIEGTGWLEGLRAEWQAASMWFLDRPMPWAARLAVLDRGANFRRRPWDVALQVRDKQPHHREGELSEHDPRGLGCVDRPVLR